MKQRLRNMEVRQRDRDRETELGTEREREFIFGNWEVAHRQTNHPNTQAQPLNMSNHLYNNN